MLPFKKREASCRTSCPICGAEGELGFRAVVPLGPDGPKFEETKLLETRAHCGKCFRIFRVEDLRTARGRP